MEASQINKFISQADTRLNGLVALKDLLLNIPDEQFIQHSDYWITTFISFIERRASSLEFNMSCVVVAAMLPLTANISQMYRDWSQTHVLQLIRTIITSPDELTEGALILLESCLRYYPTPCGTLKNKIEAFLHSLLVSSFCKSAMTCLPLLALCGGVGGEKQKGRQSWNDLMNRLVNDAVYLVSNFLGPYVPDNLKCLRRDVLPFLVNDLSECVPSLDSTTEDDVHGRAEAVVRCLQCLRVMIAVRSSCVVDVPVSDLLSILEALLSVSPTVLLLRPTMVNTWLADCLPEVGAEVFLFLEALIELGKRNLLPYRQRIISLFYQACRWVGKNERLRHSSPYRLVRISLYSVLCAWLRICGAASGLALARRSRSSGMLLNSQQDGLDALCAIIVQDIIPQGNFKVKRNDYTPATKKRNIKSNTVLKETTTSPVNSKVCGAALHLLDCYLTTVPSNVDSHFFANLLLSVTSCCQTHLLTDSRAPAPYHDSLVRRALYKALLASTISDSTLVSRATVLFTHGCKDYDSEISLFCRVTLSHFLTKSYLFPTYNDDALAGNERTLVDLNADFSVERIEVCPSEVEEYAIQADLGDTMDFSLCAASELSVSGGVCDEIPMESKNDIMQRFATSCESENAVCESSEKWKFSKTDSALKQSLISSVNSSVISSVESLSDTEGNGIDDGNDSIVDDIMGVIDFEAPPDTL